jgi:predicted GNAT superfamily acetyltransferase
MFRPAAGSVLVEIPRDILGARDASPVVAARWRATSRRAFLHYLSHGYAVSGFRRDLDGSRCAYLLTRVPRPAEHAAHQPAASID